MALRFLNICNLFYELSSARANNMNNLLRQPEVGQ
jgi:hypothetical protein